MAEQTKASKKAEAEQRKAETQARNRAKAEEAAAKRQAEEAAEREAVALGLATGELKGDRGNMEDRAVACRLPSGARFGAIYDGHSGSACAEFFKVQLHLRLQESAYWYAHDDANALRHAFSETNTRFFLESNGNTAGTTATCAIINNNVLSVASVGNSCAVLCQNGTALQLTSNEKPDMPPAGLIRTQPDVLTRELHPEDSFLLIASDGVWDVLSHQKACELVQRSLDTQLGAQNLGALIATALVHLSYSSRDCCSSNDSRSITVLCYCPCRSNGSEIPLPCRAARRKQRQHQRRHHALPPALLPTRLARRTPPPSHSEYFRLALHPCHHTSWCTAWRAARRHVRQ